MPVCQHTKETFQHTTTHDATGLACFVKPEHIAKSFKNPNKVELQYDYLEISPLMKPATIVRIVRCGPTAKPNAERKPNRTEGRCVKSSRVRFCVARSVSLMAGKYQLKIMSSSFLMAFDNQNPRIYTRSLC